MSDRIGVFGGTFNPIHYGHLKIAEMAYEKFLLSKVLVIPSGYSYFKKDQDIPEGKIRYEMCRIACEGIPYLEVSDIEVIRKGNSYTCDTLRQLKGLYPDTELIYILGADSLSELKYFKNPDEIFALCSPAVSVREGYDEKALLEVISEYERVYNADIKVFNTLNIDISSTMVREYIHEGKNTDKLIPEALGEYIRKNGLYL